MIIRATVTHSDLKKSTPISLKSHLKIYAMPTSTTTDPMTLKFFPDIMQLLKN